MKFGIGPRLFLAVLLSLAALGGTGIVAVRWSLFGGDPSAVRQREPDSPKLVRALDQAFRDHGGWAFLPADAGARRDWLRNVWLRTPGGAGTFGDRIGLLDADGHVLSGVVPGPLLRALGSIDQRRLPLVVDGRTVGYLVVAGAANPDDRLAVAFLLRQRERLALLAGVGVLVSITLASLLAAHFRKPIGKLVDGARMLERGRFDTRLDDSRRDELGALAGSFNHLAERLEHIDLARRQWVADTSHELRTPLAVLRAQIESLEDGIRAPTPENLRLMLAHVEALTRRVDDLYALARADMGQMHYVTERLDLAPIVQAVVDTFQDRAAAAGVALTVGAHAPDSTILCDGARMRQVLINLLENAVRYTDAGGAIRIEAESDDGWLCISIDDSAPGVPEPLIGRIGERFFRTDAARAGTHGGAGLGLALARQIVEAQGGQLDFAASAMGGLRARISLPPAGAA